MSSDIEFSDNDDNNSFNMNISDVDDIYSNSDDNLDSNLDSKFEIDMDIDSEINTKINTKIENKSSNLKKPLSRESEVEVEVKNKLLKKPVKKLNITRKTINKDEHESSKTTIEQNENSKNKSARNDTSVNEKKPLKADELFELNDETIDFYCKDLDIKKICCKKSTFTNDTVLLCMLFKYSIITEYRCNNKKCKIGKTWCGKPIQLLINRINKVFNDLSTNNLELLCPNCYMGIYGVDIFMKTLKQTIYKCKLCNYPLSSFKGGKKKEGYCMSCESKIINSTYGTTQYEYLNKLKETIDSNSPLKADSFSKSSYYNEVSQYKTFKPAPDKPVELGKIGNVSSNEQNSKPIIKLNMNVPNLSDLIGDDDF